MSFQCRKDEQFYEWLSVEEIIIAKDNGTSEYIFNIWVAQSIRAQEFQEYFTFLEKAHFWSWQLLVALDVVSMGGFMVRPRHQTYPYVT